VPLITALQFTGMAGYDALASAQFTTVIKPNARIAKMTLSCALNIQGMMKTGARRCRRMMGREMDRTAVVDASRPVGGVVTVT